MQDLLTSILTILFLHELNELLKH
ncbi:Protein of unknown function [Lactobacillus helveticus CIRM-BIA 101]|nr:Protein of unknown function [Lactobacillus helveticus CIRM-BIA 101]